MESAVDVCSMLYIKEEIKLFCQTTSVKGIPRITRNQSKLLCVIWTISVVAFLAVAVYQSVFLIKDYYQHATTKVVRETIIDFATAPDVVLCNSDPFSSLSALARSNMTSLKEFRSRLQKLTNCGNCTDKERKERAALKKKLDSSFGFYQYFGKEAAMAASHDIRNMIVDCQIEIMDGITLKQLPCEGRVNITHHMSMFYYNCYRVHTNIPEALGFSFISYIDNFAVVNMEYANAESDIYLGPGLVIYLLEQDTLWSGFTTQTWISPGTFNNVQFGILVRDSLPPPYGVCAKENFDGELYKMPHKRTLAPCFGLCKETEIAKKCCCKHPRELSLLDEFDQMRQLPYCSNISTPVYQLLANEKCAEKVSGALVEQCWSACPTPCTEINFHPSVVRFPWPPQNCLESFYESYIKGHQYESHFESAWNELTNGTKTRLQELISQNFVKYRIFPIDYKYIHTHDEPKIALINLLSQIGGILNLWSGITFFIIIEFIELIIRLFGKESGPTAAVEPIQEKDPVKT